MSRFSGSAATYTARPAATLSAAARAILTRVRMGTGWAGGPGRGGGPGRAGGPGGPVEWFSLPALPALPASLDLRLLAREDLNAAVIVPAVGAVRRDGQCLAVSGDRSRRRLHHHPHHLAAPHD